MPRNQGWSASRRRAKSTGTPDEAANLARDHWSNVGSKLNLLRVNGRFCDVVIRVDKETFSAHKIVLASCSPYFEAMFTAEFEEKAKPEISINEMCPKIFQCIFDYMYKGELDINVANVEQLLAGANFLDMQDIVSNCSTFLRKNLSSSNAVGVFRFAECYNCTELKLTAKRFIERHFAEVVKEDEFYELPKTLLQQFLRSEGLSIYSEFQVFEATMKWILKSPESRREHVAELLELVRLPLVSPKQIESFIADCSDQLTKCNLETHMKNHSDELEMLKKDRESMLSVPNSTGLNDFQNSYHNIRFQPRMCCRKSVYIVGGSHQPGQFYDDCRTLQTVEKLDTSKWQWMSFPSLSQGRSSLGVAALNSIIYAVGGETDSMILDSCEALDPLDKQWYSVASLRQPRSCLGLCALDGYLYAFGGWIGLDVDQGIERYDPVNNQWEYYDQLPTKMFGMGIVAYEGLIYIIGGFDERSCSLNSVYSYNPVTKQYTKLPDISHARGYFGAVQLHNFVYVVGGTSGPGTSLASVERYSLLDNSWRMIAPLSVARIAPCVTAVNDRVLVIGGKVAGSEWSMQHTLDTVQIYDPELNKWRDGCPMPTSRCEAAAIVL
ncbi:Actin-binding protein IPP [Halotydeus destructor]|nr:Actin-binding protein IPP [Halotydeus destructor]